MKVCKTCNKKLGLSDFHKHKNSKDGLSTSCKSCVKIKSKYWYDSNKEYAKIRAKIYAQENPEKVRLWKLKYRTSEKGKEVHRVHRKNSYRQNPEKYRSQSKYYRENNPDKRSHWQKAREARKKQACPKWLSDGQLSDIQDLYKLRDKLSKVFGVDYHVDHIVPLNGKDICGLHVPWNLQILESSLNLSKSNKY